MGYRIHAYARAATNELNRSHLAWCRRNQHGPDQREPLALHHNLQGHLGVRVRVRIGSGSGLDICIAALGLRLGFGKWSELRLGLRLGLPRYALWMPRDRIDIANIPICTDRVRSTAACSHRPPSSSSYRLTSTLLIYRYVKLAFIKKA